MIRAYQGLLWTWGDLAAAPGGGQSPAASRYRMRYKVTDVIRIIVMLIWR